ncbi:MAG TPA: hypothetical protein VFT64_06855 [Rickettsiales bacterium]|nr:hypothetical protein [Rickettsiales bacterium]
MKENKKSLPIDLLAGDAALSATMSGNVKKQVVISTSAARADFERDLFSTPGGEILYVEPSIMDVPQELNDEAEPAAKPIKIDEIISSSSSFIIEARSEYGGTTLCRRLVWEFDNQKEQTAHLRDARKLPNYRKKLATEFEAFSNNDHDQVLILDNFDIVRDEKLLKEVRSLNLFKRYILLVSSSDLRHSGALNFDQEPFEFSYCYLWGLVKMFPEESPLPAY